MKIIAHRGASAQAPENTRESMRLAWELKADGAELDVRLTRDGEIVVHHDATTLRTTGEDRVISETDWPNLMRLNAGRWKGEAWSDVRIPLLSEVIDELPADKVLMVEIKGAIDINPILEMELAEMDMGPDRLSFLGFDFEILQDLRIRFPDHQVIWNRDRLLNEGPTWTDTIDTWIATCRNEGFSGLGLDTRVRIDGETVDKIHAEALALFAWTVNDREEAIRLRDLGIDRLATDQPDLL